MIQLDAYHIMVVSQYFSSFTDFIALEMVCKKYNGNFSRFHFNPIPINNTIIKLRKLRLSSIYNFFVVNIWYPVDYSTSMCPQNKNFSFKRICYTSTDLNAFGNLIPLNVVSIANKCFSDYQSDTFVALTLPNKINSLGESSFAKCYLQIESINNSCFSFCTSLVSVRIPVCLGTLGDSAFYGCYSLQSFEVPKGITELGKYCFGRCTSLSKVRLPRSLSIIADGCFSECKNLKEIVLPNNLKMIGREAFYGCQELTNFVIPKSVTEIQQEAFRYCGLTSINIPDSFITLPYGGFIGCTNLVEVVMSSSIKEIEMNCFVDCRNLSAINFTKNLKRIWGGAFWNCSSLNEVVVCNNTKIDKDAFQNNTYVFRREEEGPIMPWERFNKHNK
ncbi:hypothetical protein EIN_234210 [Entamoeba invadens IP1]|uniref:Leucine rich repeat containing protein BspA family protein n=1 Tax=Entamoeba invadens IP1 TaxID=370355 RepID=L7FKZ3_ENTIV|nr:hypothetical protein EIN_234210 [Entamoeba invadens IP1]ELP86004.1 hypothetical protein EIN_234210 [Entamoeba invadens IP1]|eukprot:XP_004185350.1 hypothetical protein EIN_234210 [Entamoeba invadens IP1]